MVKVLHNTLLFPVNRIMINSKLFFSPFLLPCLALSCSLVAYLKPEYFLDMKSAIVPLLSVIMFGMGLTLTFDDFRRVVRRPSVIGAGLLIQYAVMPFAGFILARTLCLSPYTAAGLILVGASPGGTASNLICFLARGDVALSITLTSCSTLMAVFATPLLTWFYVGQAVPVPAMDMLISIVKIVFIPVAAGVVINFLAGTCLEKIRTISPIFSTLAIALIIAIIVALNRDNIGSTGPVLFFAIIMHNICGLSAGYFISRFLGYDIITARTIAIETGMQNSGLSVALAIKYFSHAAALPGALFSVWHNLSGAVLAAIWNVRPLNQREVQIDDRR